MEFPYGNLPEHGASFACVLCKDEVLRSSSLGSLLLSEEKEERIALCTSWDFN